MLRRIGVLTGGGDCPGLNAAVRAVVKAAQSRHRLEVVGFLDGYAGVVEGRVRPLSADDVSGILASGGTILGTSNRADPFRYAEVRSDGSLQISDRSADALREIERRELDGLVVIGGDGSMAIAHQLSVLGVPVVGLPKTIDNDLDATDVTFGFDSALSVATDAVDRLRSTAESHHRIMVLEVMGRNAGWIALRAGIAGGGDVILIPEIPYEPGKICDAIRQRVAGGKRFSIVVVAEGAKPVGGEVVVERTVPGSPDPVRLGGVGAVVAHQLELSTGLESRVTVLGHLQRGGAPTGFDRWLATRFGVVAVGLLAEGRSGRMVCLRGQNIESVEIEQAIDRLRRVDPHGEEVEVARAVGSTFGD
jgi:ATP-dependent phosphofructokinase / diphosphate-dependent phosphofructokinase